MSLLPKGGVTKTMKISLKKKRYPTPQLEHSSLVKLFILQSNLPAQTFADLQWFDFSPCCIDAEVITGEKEHPTRNLFNVQPERETKHSFTACL